MTVVMLLLTAWSVWQKLGQEIPAKNVVFLVLQDQVGGFEHSATSTKLNIKQERLKMKLSELKRLVDLYHRDSRDDERTN
jgi:glycyl-tRNA synthetase alpha subunit